MCADELCSCCGVAARTGGNKATPIRDQLHINHLDGKWMHPIMVETHPLARIISVKDFFVAARLLPRLLHEAAYR